MGIDNIHILTDPDSLDQDLQVRRKENRVSQHTVMAVKLKESDNGPDTKFVYGWDQMLQSFYFQKHDLTRPEDDEENPRIVVWLGALPDTRMYEVEDLVRVAHKHGLHIDPAMRVKLYGEKDDGV